MDIDPEDKSILAMLLATDEDIDFQLQIN